MDTFDTPIDDRYFEDYRPGATYEFADTITVDGPRMIEFATEFDPQPFHVDPAADSPFGGLIASGWHTAGIMMRLFADNYLSRVASLASPGVDEMRWLVPVRPGDTLRLRTTVLDAKRSKSKPDRGIVRTRVEVLNQRDEIVMTVVATNFMRLRDPGLPSS
ncbi:MAG TPA: MaoC family dehydratase [Pseudonocardiaceae bacterium]